MDEYLEIVQRLGSATSELIGDSVANLVVGLTDGTGRIVGLDLMADRYEAGSATINELLGELRRLGGDAALDGLHSIVAGSFELPSISLTDAAGGSILFPAMSVPALLDAPAPDPLAADDGAMTPEQIRERAGDIQREAAWSMFKNVLTCLIPGGAATGIPEAYGDLTQLAGELRDLQQEVERAHITRIPEVVIVGHAESPTITMPEVVITGHPSGPVIVMPQVVITAGGDDDGDSGDDGVDEDNGDDDSDDNDDNDEDDGEDGEGGEEGDASADDGEGGLGDDTGGAGHHIPAGAGVPDVGGVDGVDGEGGLGDDTGGAEKVVVVGTPPPGTGGVEDGDGLGADTGAEKVVPAGTDAVDVGGVNDGDGLGDDTGMGHIPAGVGNAETEAAATLAQQAGPAETVSVEVREIEPVVAPEVTRSEG